MLDKYQSRSHAHLFSSILFRRLLPPSFIFCFREVDMRVVDGYGASQLPLHLGLIDRPFVPQVYFKGAPWPY